jgi:hypothetical protein
MVVEAGRRTIAEPADLAALELQAPKALAFAAEAHLRAAVSR